MTVARQRPTLEMVATRAGVGRGTASRVINGSERVSEATREAVMEAVQELGYVPNLAARSLVTRRTDTVALVVSEPDERLFAQPFFAGIVRGVSALLADRGLQLMLTTAASVSEHERLGDYLTSEHVDGVLLVSSHSDDPLPSLLAEGGVPFLHGGRPLDPSAEPLTYIDVDNIGGGYTATTHLLRSGRSRVAAIAGPQDMVAGVDRLAGYRNALADSGAGSPPPSRIAEGDFSYEGGEAAMRRLLSAGPDLDAVFVASDLMALAAVRVLREGGHRVPEDVAVVGFDDSMLALHSDPPLTTVSQPTVRMGSEMARVLIDFLAGTPVPPEPMMLETHLVIRESG